MLPLINRNLFLIPVQHNPESPALSVAAEPHAGTLPLAICLERYIHGKGKILYDFLDQSKFFTGAVRKEDRSLMNVPFVTPSKEQDADVVAASKAAGFDNLKGHKSVGGLRASIYNAMPKEGVEALVEFLKKYEAEHA